MLNQISPFSDAAKNLARNPLGIIALFLVFIYGIACMTFGFGIKNIPIEAVMLFVYFILGFPIALLVAFYRLVAYHHTKLYAPHDFPRVEDFAQLASYHSQQWKPINKPSSKQAVNNES